MCLWTIPTGYSGDPELNLRHISLINNKISFWLFLIPAFLFPRYIIMQCDWSSEITLLPKKKDYARMLIILVVTEGSYIFQYLFHNINNFSGCLQEGLKSLLLKSKEDMDFLILSLPLLLPPKIKRQQQIYLCCVFCPSQLGSLLQTVRCLIICI